MTLTEIKHAVGAGKTVNWVHSGYIITRGKRERQNDYFTVFRANGNTIGLTHKDGITLNGKESQFFIS